MSLFTSISISEPDLDNSYRANVAIVLCNGRSQVLWARRIRHDGWQFPQGGVDPGETTREAAYRELEEELGLCASHVQLIATTKNWFKYDVPKRYVRMNSNQLFRGQVQKWYLFRFLGKDSDLKLDTTSSPEFDAWKWVDYWDCANFVISFKQHVYRLALTELEPYIEQIHSESDSSSVVCSPRYF